MTLFSDDRRARNQLTADAFDSFQTVPVVSRANLGDWPGVQRSPCQKRCLAIAKMSLRLRDSDSATARTIWIFKFVVSTRTCHARLRRSLSDGSSLMPSFYAVGRANSA